MFVYNPAWPSLTVLMWSSVKQQTNKIARVHCDNRAHFCTKCSRSVRNTTIQYYSWPHCYSILAEFIEIPSIIFVFARIFEFILLLRCLPSRIAALLNVYVLCVWHVESYFDTIVWLVALRIACVLVLSNCTNHNGILNKSRKYFIHKYLLNSTMFWCVSYLFGWRWWVNQSIFFEFLNECDFFRP